MFAKSAASLAHKLVTSRNTLLTQSEENLSNCTKCNYSCTTAGSLKMHSGKNLFSCTLRNCSATTASCLKRHMLIHSEVKSFRCELCDHSCTVEHLINHKLTHIGEKPFACEQCNYSFSRCNGFKYHMLSHTVVRNHLPASNATTHANCPVS